jgi:hypothetical protein
MSERGNDELEYAQDFASGDLGEPAHDAPPQRHSAAIAASAPDNNSRARLTPALSGSGIRSITAEAWAFRAALSDS